MKAVDLFAGAGGWTEGAEVSSGDGQWDIGPVEVA